jgi:hypothetical protein
MRSTQDQENCRITFANAASPPTGAADASLSSRREIPETRYAVQWVKVRGLKVRLGPDLLGCEVGASILSLWSRRPSISRVNPRKRIHQAAVKGYQWRDRDKETKRSSRVKRDQGYEIAVRMFQREHDRWIQNALILFGSLVSIFLIYETLEDLIPISWVLALAMVISFVTVRVSLRRAGQRHPIGCANLMFSSKTCQF